jgi:two-component system, NarL family, sensor histidine kinase DesK
LIGTGSGEANVDGEFRTRLTARQKGTRYVWIGVWLVFLAPLVPGIVHGEYRPTTLAAAALVAYCVLYVRTFYLAFGQHEKTRRVGFEISALALIALSTSIGYGGDWILLFIFLSPALAAALPQRWAVAAVLTVTAVMGAFAMVGQSMGVGETTNLLFCPLFGGLLTVFIKRTRGLIRELRETREELARTAVAEERLRFARDLHDLLGHTLSLVVVKSEAVRRLADRGNTEAASREAADIEAVGRQALAEVREAVTGYRGRGLASELDNARSTLADVGIEATVLTSGTPLPVPADTLLGWAVREGVTNVIRHSRAARRCEVTVSRHGGEAVLEMVNDGAGKNGTDKASSSGLTGLAERAADAGGRLEFGPRPGGKFRLSVAVPVRKDGG